VAKRNTSKVQRKSTVGNEDGLRADTEEDTMQIANLCARHQNTWKGTRCGVEVSGSEDRMNIRRYVVRPAFAVCLFFVAFNLSGCTPAEESEIITSLQGSLDSLTQNKTLTAQFVRDIKATVNPSDPGYAQVMDSYQNAREAYDHYLDTVETDSKAPLSRSLRQLGPIDVQNATADFLADATSVLKPAVNTRRIPFQRAVVIPDNLRVTLAKLPKKAREKVIDQFDRQVRWQPWGQL
jgi:hypothetical protein